MNDDLKVIFIAGPPEATIRRRFASERKNFERLYAPQVDAWALYNNSGPQPVLLDWSEKP